MSKDIFVNNERIPFSDIYDFDKIFTYDHLFKSYKNCKKGVNWKASTQSFTANAPLKVYQLYKALHNGTFRSYGFCEFDIQERGKKRHIRSVRIEERVVQRCLCDYSLVPALSRHFVYDNGACLKNKGYDFTIRRLKCHLQKHYRRYGTEGYVLLFDFSKFFDTIPHELIKQQLVNEYRDERIINLTFHFIEMFGNVGLGLGSQVSQILALSSANSLDHFIKEDLGIDYYSRYNDDGYLIDISKEHLQYCLKEITAFCAKIGLNLNLKKTQIVKLSKGFTYLKAKHRLTESGYVVRRISRDSVTRERVRLKKLETKAEAGKLTVRDVDNSVTSWEGHAKRFNSYRTRTKIRDDLER